MYNIKLTDYIPEPKPATPKMDVAVHYYAAWKKGAARIHNAFNDLAVDFPYNTPLMGYYDEENPEVCDWEIKWALEHGINCFIYCWYRNLDNMGKPVTENDLRCGHGIHEALFNAKYGNMMKFAIMYEASQRWGGADEEDMLNNLMPFWTETYFKRGNYLKFDNKPVLFVYNNARLVRDFFPTPADQKRAFDRCREYAVKAGFAGLIIAACDTRINADHHADFMARGFDFRFGYNAGYSPAASYPAENEVIEAQLNLLKQRFEIDPLCHTATASCFSDPTPRTTQHWVDMGYGFRNSKIWYTTPEGYREVIRRMLAEIDKLPKDAWARRLFMIDNWNEWDEGHFVAPSHRFGFGFLQAIREELTLRDNLPDYRMPQDTGFGGYNKSWIVPDFTEKCARILAEKRAAEK